MNTETGLLGMMMADGTWLGVLTMFVVGFAGAFFFRVEYFFLCFALVGVGAGVLSVNGAVALWLAERSGLAFRDLWSARALSASTRALLKESAVVQLVGALIGFLMIGFLRDFWGPVSGIGTDGLPERMNLFLTMSVLVEIPVFLTLNLWGHWRGKKIPEDLFQVSYPRGSWFAALRPRRFVLSVALQQAALRRDEILRLRQDFASSDWKGVPAAIRTGSEKDLAELDQCLLAMEAHLLSRSSLFDHQLS
jgi:hypothetical protein